MAVERHDGASGAAKAKRDLEGQELAAKPGKAAKASRKLRARSRNGNEPGEEQSAAGMAALGAGRVVSRAHRA